MSAALFAHLPSHSPLLLAVIAAMPVHAQLVAYEGFGDYTAGIQVESGENGSAGTGLDAGAGWGGAFDINNAIKSLVKIENRSSSPVNYSNGGLSIFGGNRALRFYDIANSSYALQRPLGTTFDAAAGEALWFSVLFRTSAASPLSNQDFIQIGFDDNATAVGGVPRVSIGANTIQASFPSPFRFFARSTTAVAASAFHDNLNIAAATTYLLVGRIQPHEGIYDTVSLFVNPVGPEDPGPPSAEMVLPSGLVRLSHAFIRTAGLDSGDANVIDEWLIGRDYGSVVQSLQAALRWTAVADGPLILRWPVAPSDAVLQASNSLAADSWTDVTGPFARQGAEWEYAVVVDSGTPQRFFRLRR